MTDNSEFDVASLFKSISMDFEQKFFSSEEAIICELHDLLDKGSANHNCLACNLASNYILIKNHLQNSDRFKDLEYAFTSTILLYYLLVEKFFAIFKSLEIAGLKPENYRNSHKSMRNIWYWANFLKHPKAYMFVHEAKYADISQFTPVEEEESSSNAITLDITVIDDNFVKKYYSGSKNNKELYLKLKNKDNVLVVFPNLIELNNGLKEEIGEFELAVKSSVEIIEHLHQEATIIEFWNE